MSALSALKGYRTQFLYSLHYILSNQGKNYLYRLEGKEDLDILDAELNIKFAIQVKNLGKTLTLSDILSEKRTSFLGRFLESYHTSVPILVSFGKIADDLKGWNEGSATVESVEKKILSKYKISAETGEGKNRPY